MNKFTCTGHITKELELRYSVNDKPICKGSIAVKRNFVKEEQQDTDFFNFVLFGKRAETFNKYLGKGSKVLLNGSVQIDKVEKEEGNRYYTNFIVDDFEFLDKKPMEQTQPQSQPSNSNVFDNNSAINSTDSDLPF